MYLSNLWREVLGERKLSTSTKSCYKFSLCCGQGKVASPPQMLMHLLTAADKRGREFRDKIRAYSSALAFASLGVNFAKELANARLGVYTFRIQGVVQHYIGQLHQERERLRPLPRYSSMMGQLRAR